MVVDFRALSLPALNPVEVPAGASAYMQDVIATLNAQRPSYKERDALKKIEEPLNRLKSAPAADRLAFVFEALTSISNQGSSIILNIALKGIVSQLMRTELPIDSLDAVRMVEIGMNRWQRFYFPYKALLGAFESVMMTPALKEALLGLREIIGPTHGMDDIQERIERPGSWSQGETGRGGFRLEPQRVSGDRPLTQATGVAPSVPACAFADAEYRARQMAERSSGLRG